MPMHAGAHQEEWRDEILFYYWCFCDNGHGTEFSGCGCLQTAAANVSRRAAGRRLHGVTTVSQYSPRLTRRLLDDEHDGYEA